MTKQTVEDKANAYLIDGKVGVAYTDGFQAIVRVEGTAPQPYQVDFKHELGWTCDCPAHIECAHLVAAKKILPHLQVDKNISLGSPDADLTAFLDEFNADTQEEDFS